MTPSAPAVRPSRRTLLQVGAAAGGGLLVSFLAPIGVAAGKEEAAPKSDFAPNAFIRIDRSGNPYILEINPNPSINDGDCVPACAEVIGYKYADFIEEIMKECISRYRARPQYYHLQ